MIWVCQFCNFYQEYDSLYAKKCNHKKDGCVISFKRNKFSLVSDKTVNFNAKVNPSSSCPLRFSSNVAKLALLGFKSDESKMLLVATTHLFFSPNRGDTKLNELCITLAEMDKLMHKHAPAGCPVILAGDFNSEPDSKLVLNFLLRRSLDVKSVYASSVSNQNPTSFIKEPNKQLIDTAYVPPRDWSINDNCTYSEDAPIGTGLLQHQFCLKPAHSYWLEENFDSDISYLPTQSYRNNKFPDKDRSEGRLVTSFTSADTCAVDYVLYGNHKAFGDVSLKLIYHFRLPRPQELRAIGGLPNYKHGSDHLPLTAKFAFLD